MLRRTYAARLLSILLWTAAAAWPRVAAEAETPSSILITNVDVFGGE